MRGSRSRVGALSGDYDVPKSTCPGTLALYRPHIGDLLPLKEFLADPKLVLLVLVTFRSALESRPQAVVSTYSVLRPIKVTDASVVPPASVWSFAENSTTRQSPSRLHHPKVIVEAGHQEPPSTSTPRHGHSIPLTRANCLPVIVSLYRTTGPWSRPRALLRFVVARDFDDINPQPSSTINLHRPRHQHTFLSLPIIVCAVSICPTSTPRP